MNKSTTFYDELLASDWLGRDPKEYTHAKKGVGIGWEETLTKGDAISSFILKANKNPSTEKQILMTKQACSTIVNRMNFLKRPVNVTFSKDFNSYRQGDKICVTLEPLFGSIKFPSFNHKLDPILGYCVHEMAHVLYTKPEYHNHLMKFKGKEQEVKKMIMNILEDERIEQKISTAFRGYTDYIGKAKDHSFGKKWAEKIAEKNLDTEEDINQLFTSFLHLVRYPKALQRDIVNKFEKELSEIKDILTPYPETLSDLTRCADGVYGVLKNFLEDDSEMPEMGGNSQSKDQDDSSSQQDNQQGGGKGKSQKQDKKDKGDEENDTDKDNSSGNNEDDSEEGDEEKSGQGGSEEDGEEENSDERGGGSDEEEESNDGDASDEQDSDEDGDNGDGDSDSGDDNNSGSKDSLGDALQDILSVLAESMPEDMTSDQIAQKMGQYQVAPVIREVNNFDNSDLNDRKGHGHVFPVTQNLQMDEMDVVFQSADKLNASQNNYDYALNNVKSYASSLRAKFQQLNRNHSVTFSGLCEGDFDDTLLVDAIVGAKNVYKEEHKIRNKSAVIGLLIDESGSMGGHHINKAREIAVLFERALEGVNNIDFYCYGHTTGSFMANRGFRQDATHINVYFEGRKKSNRKNLGKIYSHNTNRDGHAILEVVGRMREQVSMDKPIILFMISDGEPSARVPSPYNGVTYTRKAVETVEKFANTTICHIAIESGIPSKDMFNTFLTFTNPQTLVHDIGNVLKKIMIKQQSAEIL